MNAPIVSQDRAEIPKNSNPVSTASAPPLSRAPAPDAAERIADLHKLAALLKDNREALVAAINADYGHRSTFETLFVEYFIVLEGILNSAKHVKKWMKPQRRAHRCHDLPRREKSRHSATAGRGGRDRAVEFSAFPELRSAGRHFRGRQPGHGQDVGKFATSRGAADRDLPKIFSAGKTRLFR